MSTRTQRERAEYAGYGWGMCALLLGIMALGMLFTLDSGGLGSLVWFGIFAVGAYYSFQAYDKAQRRGRDSHR